MQNKKNIALMYAIALLQGMVFYGPIATLYRQAAGVGIFEITLIESISLAVCIVLELPCGMAADKIGYKNMMVCCCGLYFLSKIVFWQAYGFWPFLAERLMLSFVMAGLSGLDVSILYLSCGPERSQKVFGVYNNLNTAGLLAAAWVYSIAIGDNYRLAGLLTVISYGAAAVLTLFLTDVRPPDKKSCTGHEFGSILRSALHNPRLMLLVCGVALLNETHQTITVFLNQLQYVECGMTDRAIGLVYVGVTLSGLCGGASALITRGMGEKKLGIALYAVCAASCALLALTKGAVLSVAAIVLMRISFSLFQPLQMNLQNRQISTRSRATALSVNAVMMESVAVGTNLAFGAASGAGTAKAMALGAAMCFVGVILFISGLRAIPPAASGGSAENPVRE